MDTTAAPIAARPAAPATARPAAGSAPGPGPLDPALRAELTELTVGLCKALSDPKRLMVLYALAAAPRSVTELAEAVDAREANVSQHLAVLRERGLVDTERRGTSVIYSLRYPELVDAIDRLRGVLHAEVERRSDLVGSVVA
jgi:DNA-binding transcriptional ArsR family regulator